MEKKSKKYEIKVEGKDSGFESIQIVESSAAEKYARQFFSDDIILYESCFIMLLNRSNKVIGWAKVSQGGISSTVVDVSIVCKYVVDTLAKGVILVHNHPSGIPTPGSEDMQVTGRLRNALRYFDCCLIDHIIITEDNAYSFADGAVVR